MWICVFMCWASIEIKGLCLVFNKNWFCLMFVHMCVTKFASMEGIYVSMGGIVFEDIPLDEFMFLLFTHHWWLGSLLLCLCGVFQALFNFLVCLFLTFCYERKKYLLEIKCGKWNSWHTFSIGKSILRTSSVLSKINRLPNFTTYL